MKKDMLKKGIGFLALAGSILVGMGGLSNANAQNPRWERQRRIEQPRGNGVYGPIESTGNIDQNKNGIDDRWEVNGQVDINQNGIPDNQEYYNRDGRNWRYNGNNGYWRNRGNYNNADYHQGYRDGLSRGRDDARTNRAMTPYNSSHYRNGNDAYCSGFERGFYEAYDQYRNRRW